MPAVNVYEKKSRLIQARLPARKRSIPASGSAIAADDQHFSILEQGRGAVVAWRRQAAIDRQKFFLIAIKYFHHVTAAGNEHLAVLQQDGRMGQLEALAQHL